MVTPRPEVYFGRVDQDAVVAFARATNDAKDLYFQEVAVPPLFTVSLILEAHRKASRALLPMVQGEVPSVHGEHDVRLLRPVVANMELQWEASMHGMRNSPAGMMDTIRIVVADRQGTPLVEHFWSNFTVGATVAEELGADKADHSFPEAARHHLIETRTVPIDRDQTFRYAGVSGDHAPHAMDDERARAEGYPGKIMQGLCVFGICSGAVTDVVAGGDPRRIRRLACRFARPVFPRGHLSVDLYDAGEALDGGRSFAFEARQEEITVIKHGRAEIGPPDQRTSSV
jgi:acyl dehydratase